MNINKTGARTESRPYDFPWAAVEDYLAREYSWLKFHRRAIAMIFGAHMIIYSKDADADRLFLKDILGFVSVDAGHGWLIFALPPAEVACHPADENDRHELFFMCEDLNAEMSTLSGKGVACSEVQEAPWGSITRIHLPGGGKVGLYQPKHPTALELR